ncbi:unnamed protein product, partial [Closterium sp. NIES-53]
GVPLSPFSPLLLLLLLSTSLALRRSGQRLLSVGGATTARARGVRVVEGTAGAAAEAVEEGVVPRVGASVAAVEVVEAAAEVVEATAAVVEVAAVVVLDEVQPRSVEALVVASASSSRVPVRPRRPSSLVSGTLGVGGLGLRQNVAIFDLDFDAILAAMYALTNSAEGDCNLSVPPDPGIEAAALGASASAAPGTGESTAPGASESALSGTAPTEALHTFTLDSSASRSLFRDSTSLTPLSRPVAVSLADPSGGPVLAHSTTVLPCPAASSGLLSGLHLPLFSTNLVSGADLQDAWHREWFLRGASGGSCPYVIHTGDQAGQTCEPLHTQHHCFSRLDDAWRAEYGDDVELPRWADLLKSRIAIFDLDFDANISAMYALSVSAEGDCYFDSTTLTPLPTPVSVRLADPSGCPVVASSSTIHPCPAVPSGSLSGLHLPSFSTNLVR